MMKTKHFAALLLMCSAFAAQAAPVSGAEQKFREQMGMADYQRIEYRDEKGARISFEQFQKMLPTRSFGMEKTKSGGQSSAVVKLETKGAKITLPKFKLAAGADFPAFKLRSTDDSPIDNAALKGRYTLVNFFFAECAPCIKEVPALNEFAARNKNYGVLAITFDSPDVTKRFIRRTKFNWRIVTDANELIDQVGVKAFPSFAIIDPKGVVVAISNDVEASTQGWSLDKWVSQAVAGHTL